ncbi:Acyl transferase/acyl hydrolase/lysophospholipase [Penicillium expansum]|nr:Acyl transferase/acyl hydrolase/lysophospholipase [Penicillium expansum]
MAPSIVEDVGKAPAVGENGYPSKLEKTSVSMGHEAKHQIPDGAVTTAINGIDPKSGFEPKPIAICGMAMRLPGGVHDSGAFWDVLVNGKDTRGPIPQDRYNAQGFTDRTGHKGAIKTQFGYFIEDDLTALDTSFFTFTKTELERTDPQQRQLLEVAREVLENAGEANFRGESIGCYVGTFGEDWLQMSAKENQHAGGYIMTGHGDLMLANRISFEYDLKGPSMVVKTGCSASLVGLHEACRAIQYGDCKSAIVAGCNLIIGPTTTAAMTQEGILAADGSCKTFDAKADGFARGEAVTAVYIKDLDDAIRDGNPIRAIIRNTGTNSDGKSEGLMTPNSKSHEALMRKVYTDAHLDPSLTGFVECHGTGTATGDPLETTAVGEVFGASGVYIGSVKPNVGHSEGASGVTSLIKAVLALEHGVIPPNIKFNTPNPKIPFVEKNLKVPIKPTAWPEDRERRISINSFGIGGSNAHVILESAQRVQSRNQARNEGDDCQVVIVSANTQESARQYTELIHDYMKTNPKAINDLAYTLAFHRERLPFRAYLIADKTAGIEVSPSVKAPAHTPNIVMVFSGQGAQWPQMGHELILSDKLFREDIEEMDRLLQSSQFPPSWSLKEELLKPVETSQLGRAELAQPLTTAIQIAMVNRLRRTGIEPQSVVGHSSGEIAAAYASGALSLIEALLCSYYRGYVTKDQSKEGGMAAVGLGSEQAAAYLIDGVVIACDNSPNSVTLSGDVAPLQTVLEIIKRDNPDILTRQLKVDMAYHSHHMNNMGDKYRKFLETEIQQQNLVRENPRVKFWSSVTGQVINDGHELGPKYFQSNLTCQVRFNATVQHILEHQPNNLFLEIGPNSTLAGPLRQICSTQGLLCNYVPTMLRGKNCQASALAALGQLYQSGISMEERMVFPAGRALTDLPRYAWKHTGPYWYEARVSKEWRLRGTGHHGMLGLRVPETTELEPVWRNQLSLDDEPWIADHKIVNDVVFPFAGYISMAGEAVRQLTGIEGGYRIKHAIAQSALVLSDSAPVEIVTTLRPLKISDSVNSEWFEFTISSFSGSTWIQNCQGQAKAINDVIPNSKAPEGELARQIPRSRWYRAMADIGIVYGPHFQGLSQITSSTTQNLAAAMITSPIYKKDQFPFHPASIDACLQLLLVAMAKGIGRNFGQLRVPTTIEDLTVSQSSGEMQAVAWSNGHNDVAVDCMVDGKPALQLRGLQLTSMDNSAKTTSLEPHAAARLEWNQDFDLADHSKLFNPPQSIKEETWMQEEMTLLCMLETAIRVRHLKACQPHFEQFRDWLEMENKRAADGTYPLLGIEARKFVVMSSPARAKLINELEEKLLGISTKGSMVIGIKRIYDNCERIFTGEGDTLNILMQDDVLTYIYNSMSFGKGEFFRLLCHSRPTLRVLEVGAGTGGTTETILRELIRPDAIPCYSLYSFTDISAGFFPQAKERFGYAPNMDYRVFDISKSPIEQGFEAGTYDIILAPNVVHATPSLNETLGNLQTLLRPGGLLVLTELCAVVRTPNFVFGNFSGWWLGKADGRPYEPYVPVERWDDELKAAGFSGVDTSICDAEAPYHYCAAIVSSKPLTDAVEPTTPRPVTILCDMPENGISKRFIDDLILAGVPTTVCSLYETPPADQEVISLLDLEGSFFEDLSSERLAAFQNALNRDTANPTILWVLRPTQMKCQDPRSGQAIGVARSIRAESTVPFYTLEISQDERDFSKLVLGVWKKIINSEDNELLSPDKEYVVDEGIVKVSRYRPFLVGKEISQSEVEEGVSSIKSLNIVTTGQLDTLQWAQEPLEPEVQSGDVLIDTRAIGLNFKDILYAMGILRSGKDEVPLGLEVAGVVRKIGADVTDMLIGDRVLAMPPFACAKTAVAVPSNLVQKIPDSLSFEDAATMPICYATVIESLINIGQLEKGQSVLIHSATGGVGHAAIQICRMLGAEIYVTVGSDAKVEYLMSNFDVPRDHIFHSHDASFATKLMQVTKTRGVDIVLNSLSGELLHASWDCVAEFGKMIELGKKDGTEFGKLQMNNFLLNRSYCCVDMTHLAQLRPQRVKMILTKMVELYSTGHIQPLHPLTSFEAGKAQDAFRHVQNRDHIGKAVINVPSDFSVVSSLPKATKLQLNPASSYLLTGGLGGLGKVISTWLVERGARSLVFLSRGAGSPENWNFLRELESTGCTVTIVPGKAESPDDINAAISKAPNPIRGVIHLAMVLKDSPIANMAHSDWLAANAPKVTGAWNIHEAFKEGNALDFFVLASSVITVVEQPGQGNYSAANTYLEAFCQWRRSLSLPASVLNICPIDGVGFVAENQLARKNMKAQGLYFLGESELLDFMELSILTSRPIAVTRPEDLKTGWKNPGQIVMGLKSEEDLNDTNTRTNWRRDRRMGFYHNSVEKVESGRGSSNELKQFLANVSNDPDILERHGSVVYLATEIGRKIYRFMLKSEEDLEIAVSLKQIGLDSLMAIGLHRWLKLTLGLQISILEIMSTGSIEALGSLAAKHLRALYIGECK